MRALLTGVIGGLLLLAGSIAGTAGLGLQVTNSCSPHYQVSLQPANEAADAPERTVSFESLSDYQQMAVEAARGNGTRATFTARNRLEPLTEIVIVIEGDNYVAELVKDPCQSLYDELAVGGFIGAIVGLFLSIYSVILWRLS